MIVDLRSRKTPTIWSTSSCCLLWKGNCMNFPLFSSWIPSSSFSVWLTSADRESLGRYWILTLGKYVSRTAETVSAYQKHWREITWYLSLLLWTSSAAIARSRRVMGSGRFSQSTLSMQESIGHPVIVLTSSIAARLLEIASDDWDPLEIGWKTSLLAPLDSAGTESLAERSRRR